MRVGLGYDVHRLTAGRELILGGVSVPYSLGLLGHSDADVLSHAVADALIGAAAAGDLGQHFPDSDPQFKDIRSILLLERVRSLLADQGFKVNNVDAVVAAEKPKLAPYINEMRRNIALALDVGYEAVSIKATTTEGLGFVGTGEGMAAWAIVSILD
ncbi:MAG: 2-C-methyl-D-erythritol 2,4-cyclodiphosphate synthase [Bacillota bacterium]